MSGHLTHSPADIIRHMLPAMGLGTMPSSQGSWPVYCASEPDEPDNLITTFDTGEQIQGRIQLSGEEQEFHAVLIQVRAVNFPVGNSKVRDISAGLSTNVYRRLVDIASSRYLVHSMVRRSGPIHIGTESPDSNREIFTINYLTSLREVTDG